MAKIFYEYHILLRNIKTHDHIKYGRYATENEAWEDLDNCREHFLEDNPLDNPDDWEIFVNGDEYMIDKFTGEKEWIGYAPVDR